LAPGLRLEHGRRRCQHRRERGGQRSSPPPFSPVVSVTDASARHALLLSLGFLRRASPSAPRIPRKDHARVLPWSRASGGEGSTNDEAAPTSFELFHCTPRAIPPRPSEGEGEAARGGLRLN